jgi:hypothetical protein
MENEEINNKDLIIIPKEALEDKEHFEKKDNTILFTKSINFNTLRFIIIEDHLLTNQYICKLETNFKNQE